MTGIELDLDAILAALDTRRQYIDAGKQPSVAAYLTDRLIGDVPALVAEVRRLRAELAKVRTDRDEEAALATQLRDQLANVRRLCDDYKDQPPPIFQGPGLSERGEGYNAGTRDMARAVLGTLAGEQEPCDICSGYGCPDCRDEVAAERARTQETHQ